MKIFLIVLAVLVGAVIALWIALRIRRAWKKLNHDPVEYYRGWGGYVHPIGLQHRITKEEADAYHVEGSVYLIAYFDSAGNLVRVTKMLKGSVFFDYEYAYYPNDRLKSAKISRGGRVTLQEYDKRGRRTSGTVAF
jgi:YD repeat-containing protein